MIFDSHEVQQCYCSSRTMTQRRRYHCSTLLAQSSLFRTRSCSKLSQEIRGSISSILVTIKLTIRLGYMTIAPSFFVVWEFGRCFFRFPKRRVSNAYQANMTQGKYSEDTLINRPTARPPFKDLPAPTGS